MPISITQNAMVWPKEDKWIKREIEWWMNKVDEEEIRLRGLLQLEDTTTKTAIRTILPLVRIQKELLAGPWTWQNLQQILLQTITLIGRAQAIQKNDYRKVVTINEGK